jgi:hypothetical protein
VEGGLAKTHESQCFDHYVQGTARDRQRVAGRCLASFTGNWPLSVEEYVNPIPVARKVGT